MGAACSDGHERVSAEAVQGLAYPPGPQPRALKPGAATASMSSGARYWHDKMQMSSASQAIFDAAQRGDTRRVLAALKAHGDPNCVNAAGYTPLMLAVGG